MWRRIKRVNVVYLKPESILVKYSFNIWQIKNNKEHYNDILEDRSWDPNQKFSSISCIVCLFWFYVVLLSVGNISIIRRCHQTAKLRPMFGKEGSLSCHTCWDTGPRFLQSQPKGIHSLIGLVQEARGTEVLF